MRDILTVMNRARFSAELGCSPEETAEGMIRLIEQEYLMLESRAHPEVGTLIELIVLSPDGRPIGVAASLHIHDLPWIDRDSPVSGTA